MRVFVALATLAVLASADVRHLFNAPHLQGQNINFRSGLSYGGSDSGIPSHIINSIVRPTVARLAQDSYVHQPSGQANFVQHQQHTFSAPVLSTGFVPSAPIQSGYASSSQFSGPVNSGFGGFSGVNSGFNGPVNGISYDAASANGAYSGQFVQQQAPIVTKSTYAFTAPDEIENRYNDQVVAPRPREHYKVIFIKVPSTTVVNHGSAALAQQTKEKTLIYVLSDKKRIENHIEVPQEDSQPQKPEVFFIKYNKPTEIRNSNVRYETVDAIPGAENGAVNGVANKASATVVQDEASNGQQNAIAQQIFQAVQYGGLEAGVKTVNNLIADGHPISGDFGGAQGNTFTAAHNNGFVQQQQQFNQGQNGFRH